MTETVAPARHTEAEIASQPEVWRSTLRTLDRAALLRGFDRGPNDVLVTGCGSTHYLAMTAAALLRDAGLRAHATPASELLPEAEPSLVDPGGTLLLAFSRSGSTTETLLAVESFRRLGGSQVVAVTCAPDSLLARAADVVWAIPDAAERSVAQTRSFSSMLLVGQAIAAAVAEADLSALDRLPELAERSLAEANGPMAAVAGDPAASDFYFLASGPLFGIASEGMLKLKEMSLTHSEAYHAMEFRHGPMSMCDSGSVIVALVTPERAARELAVLHDVAPMSGRTVRLGGGLDHDVPTDLPAWARPVLYLLPLQVLALERALVRGLDPDRPRYLTAAIHLDPADPA